MIGKPWVSMMLKMRWLRRDLHIYQVFWPVGPAPGPLPKRQTRPRHQIFHFYASKLILTSDDVIKIKNPNPSLPLFLCLQDTAIHLFSEVLKCSDKNLIRLSFNYRLFIFCCSRNGLNCKIRSKFGKSNLSATFLFDTRFPRRFFVTWSKGWFLTSFWGFFTDFRYLWRHFQTL